MARKKDTAIVQRVGSTVVVSKINHAPDDVKLKELSGYARYELKEDGGVVIHFESDVSAKASYEAMIADGAGGVDDFVPDDHRFEDDEGGMEKVALSAMEPMKRTKKSKRP